VSPHRDDGITCLQPEQVIDDAEIAPTPVFCGAPAMILTSNNTSAYGFLLIEAGCYLEGLGRRCFLLEVFSEDDATGLRGVEKSSLPPPGLLYLSAPARGEPARRMRQRPTSSGGMSRGYVTVGSNLDCLNTHIFFQ